MKVHKRLGEILVESNRITREQLRKALSDSSNKTTKIGEKLVALGFIDEKILYDALSKQLKIPVIPAEKFKQLLVNPEALTLIPQHFALKNVVFPIQLDTQKNSVSVAMMDPTDEEILREIKILCQTEKVKRYLAHRSSILNAISQYYAKGETLSPAPLPAREKPAAVMEETNTTKHSFAGSHSMPGSHASFQEVSITETTKNSTLNPDVAAKLIAEDILHVTSSITKSQPSIQIQPDDSSQGKSLGKIQLKKKPAEIKIDPTALSGEAPSLAPSSGPSSLLTGSENRILLIDQHAKQRSVVEQILRADGYQVTSCDSVENALQSVKSSRFDFVLLKSDLAAHQNALEQALPTQGYRQPQVRLFSSISNAMIGNPIDYNRLSQIFFQTTDYLISLLERKNPDQRRYAHTIAKYARLVAQRLTLTLLQIDEVYLAAYLHDVWKYFENLPPEDVREGEERRFIVDYFSELDSPYDIVPILRHIGEFYNGSGKPDGLKEEEIPLGSRIISVIRAFEEMLRSKLIKETKEVEKIAKLLRKAAGKKFDPKCVEAFISILEGECYLQATGVKPVVDTKSDILLVDKDPQATSLLELRLINEGFSVRVVRDGQEAARIIEQNPPMLIVSDVVLPKVDGFNLCEIVKSNPATQNIPFFFTSSRKDDFNMTKGLEMGADDYQVKPVNVPFLITKIRKTLEALPAKTSGSHSPQSVPGGVAGNLSQMGLVEIIQILGGGNKTALIAITHAGDQETANLYMERGRIVRANAGPKSGEDAFYHVMTWGDGTFAITPDLTTTEKNVNNSNDFLLLEAMRRIDESKA